MVPDIPVVEVDMREREAENRAKKLENAQNNDKYRPPDSDSDLGASEGWTTVSEDEEEGDEDEDRAAEDSDDGPVIPSRPVPFLLPRGTKVKNPLQDLANALGAVKATCYMSDSGLDKILKVIGVIQ